MAKTINQLSQKIDFKAQSTDIMEKLHKFEDDFTLFICVRCKRQCALLTKETHKPAFCPFLEFEKDNSSHIFKF